MSMLHGSYSNEPSISGTVYVYVLVACVNSLMSRGVASWPTRTTHESPLVVACTGIDGVHGDVVNDG